ncbi:MAG: hypothetical protein U5K33_04710 [Halofilum sp. (in: g-proteobacteria)]|nr:hypothetical protein [Halofilum sp. (in: g-proteobacteria)]
MWRLMLAVFAWPIAVALLASAILWYRAEFPERPIDRALDEVQARQARQSAAWALERFRSLPSVEQERFIHTLEDALVSTDTWIDWLITADHRILCLGEQHEPSTRRFLAQKVFPRYRVDTLHLEATPRELARIERWLQEGREYVPLLDADMAAILRTVRARNPDVVMRAIEETSAQAASRQGREGSRDRSLVRNFWQSWQPGGRNVILYGALHCSSRGMWLYRLLREQMPPREDVRMRNVRILGTEQHVPTRAFVHFLQALQLGGEDFAIRDTDMLPPELHQWLPFFSEDVLSRYATVVIFHNASGDASRDSGDVYRSSSRAPGSADVLPQWVPPPTGRPCGREASVSGLPCE